MAPLIDRGFHYPDLELEEKDEAQPKTSQPSTSTTVEKESKTCTTVLEESEEPEEPEELEGPEEPEGSVELEGPEEPEEPEDIIPQEETKFEPIRVNTIEPVTQIEVPPSPTDSPNSDSFEMLEKPDLIDDFVASPAHKTATFSPHAVPMDLLG